MNGTDLSLSAPSPTRAGRRQEHFSPDSGMIQGGARGATSSPRAVARVDHMAEEIGRLRGLIDQGSDTSDDRERRSILETLCRRILHSGIPIQPEESNDHLSLRGELWSIFLGVGSIDPNDYVRLVKKGPIANEEGARGALWQKVTNDAFRTFKTDELFVERVREETILRFLSSVLHKYPRQGYVQGMNVLAAPFLYIMPEAQAFACYCALIRERCPTFSLPGLDGVHEACRMFEEVFEAVDPELHNHLLRSGCEARVYAFAPLMTLCASIPPLSELLKLWDFLFAFGVHLSLVCLLSMLVMRRDELLAIKKPKVTMNDFSSLDAETVISATVALLPSIPTALYARLTAVPLGANKG